MEDLSKVSGLGLKLDVKRCSLISGNSLNKVKPQARCLSEMRSALAQRDILSPRQLYYIYRGLRDIKDADAIRKNKLRYDVTVIPCASLGNEFIKTAGQNQRDAYGGLYEVLYGTAWCLLQKADGRNPRIIEDVILVKAFAADKIIIPPGYGHTLINTAKTPLVVSEWASAGFLPEDEAYEMARGAAYFIFKDSLGERFEVNPYYREVSKIRVSRAPEKITDFGLSSKEPMYVLARDQARKLDFLNNPDKYDYSNVFEFL